MKYSSSHWIYTQLFLPPCTSTDGCSNCFWTQRNQFTFDTLSTHFFQWHRCSFLLLFCICCQGPTGIRPQMFKSMVGRGHPEFSTKRQQDAEEFFLHLVNLIGVSIILHIFFFSFYFTLSTYIRQGFRRIDSILTLARVRI